MQKHLELKLYSTEGCHLCEQALDMLHMLKVSPQVIDIAYDDTLFERYGVTIPVVNFSGIELNWPFDSKKLKIWLEENGITYHT